MVYVHSRLGVCGARGSSPGKKCTRAAQTPPDCAVRFTAACNRSGRGGSAGRPCSSRACRGRWETIIPNARRFAGGMAGRALRTSSGAGPVTPQGRAVWFVSRDVRLRHRHSSTDRVAHAAPPDDGCGSSWDEDLHRAYRPTVTLAAQARCHAVQRGATRIAHRHAQELSGERARVKAVKADLVNALENAFPEASTGSAFTAFTRRRRQAQALEVSAAARAS
jgi:hypothetical protein